MRHFSKRRFILLSPLFLIAFAGFVFLAGWIVMLLWNAVLVPAAGAATITIWQGLGLLVLSRLLVGGFSGRSRRRGGFWKEKWDNMSEEKKEAIKEKLKQKFEGRFSSMQRDDSTSSNQEEGD